MRSIPPAVTAASRFRHDLARRLASTCPISHGREVALTGSAARGVADESSDIELNFWVDALPAADERAAWLSAAGATKVAMDVEETPDGTLWSACRYQDVWVEAGWQSLVGLDANLKEIVAGRVIEHRRLMVAAMLRDAVFLRTSGLGTAWQQTLASYPEHLAGRLIDAAVEGWLWPQWLAERWALIRRGDLVPLTRTLVSDVHNVLRILFAINRQWEPDWKWLPRTCRELQLRPDRLLERIDMIVGDPMLERRLRSSLELALDTLALVLASHDVSRAAVTIKESLARFDGGR